MSSNNFGLHSSQIYFIRSQRDLEKAHKVYNEWLTKRAKTRQSLIDQIESIKQSNPSSKKSVQLLGRLEYQLQVMDLEDSEVPDPAFLERFPSAHKCHRPAYVKLALENKVKKAEETRKLAQMMFRKSISIRTESGDLPPYVLRELEALCADVPTPTSPETGSSPGSPKEPKMSFMQKVTSMLAKIDNHPSMTKTFPKTLRDANSSRWAFRAETYYPKNPTYPAHLSPSP